MKQTYINCTYYLIRCIFHFHLSTSYVQTNPSLFKERVEFFPYFTQTCLQLQTSKQHLKTLFEVFISSQTAMHFWTFLAISLAGKALRFISFPFRRVNMKTFYVLYSMYTKSWYIFQCLLYLIHLTKPQLFTTFHNWTQLLCPVLGSSVQVRYGAHKVGRVGVNKDVWGTEASLLWGEAEGFGPVQPWEETAYREPY